MKQKVILLTILSSSFFLINKSVAQTTPLLPLTADSLASGNYKDVFKSFFQIAFNHFASNNKEIEFSSNPFAIMAKMNPSLLKSTNYVNYTHLRNLNFSFSAKIDSAYKFNGFSSGINYALINKRDETVSTEFVRLALKTGDEFFQLNNALTAFIAIQDTNRQIALNEQKNKLFEGKINISQLDTDLQKELQKRAVELNAINFLELSKKDPDLNIGRVLSTTYDNLRTRFHERLLWTVGLSDTTYKNQFFFSNVVLSTELLKGLSDPTKPLKPVGAELNMRGALNLIDDTLRAGRNLQRIILQFEPGLNLVFRVKKALYSYAEFKLSGSYYHNFSGLYANERRDSLTLNGTLRLRIINDIWIPLEIKYDPKSGNVFGFLNLRVNF